jgi:Endosomal/lysosomal potassium channel TMEM175
LGKIGTGEAAMKGTLMNTKHLRQSNDDRGTGRLEAFSDGVIAVAITLLILDIHVPNVKICSEI